MELVQGFFNVLSPTVPVVVVAVGGHIKGDPTVMATE
jgi:hypothetical protein